MRKLLYLRFICWWQELGFWSVVRFLLFPFIAAIWILKVALLGIVAGVVIYVALAYPSAWKRISRSYREAIASGQTDHDSTRLEGGEARQGSERKGSLVRPGGPLSSDDLRRRLYELRSLKSERTIRRAPIEGVQNGE